MLKTKSPGYRWVILVVCFLVLTIGYTYHSLWSLMLEDIMAEFGIENSTAQLGNTALILGYAVAGYVLAIVAAKIGRKLAASIGLILFVIGTIVIPLTDSFMLILIMRFFQGTGMVWGLTVGLASAWFPAKSRGMASGIVGGGLSVGAGIGGKYAAMVYSNIPEWREAFRTTGWLLIAFVVAFFIFASNAPENLYPEETAAGSAEVKTSKYSKRSVWTIPAAWLCALALFMVCWSGGFTNILPQYCYSLGYSVDQVGNALLWLGIAGMIMIPFSGTISDFFIRRGVDHAKARAYTMAIAGFLPGCIVMFVGPLAKINFGLVILVCIMQSFVATFGNAALGSLPMDLMNDSILADKMFGMTILCGVSGGLLIPYIAGFTADIAGWTIAFVVSGAASVVGIVIGFIMPKFKLK